MLTKKTFLPRALSALGALLLVIAMAAFLGAPSASADPNIETQLPADGVLSIQRVGTESWIVTTDGSPMEVKLMSGSNPRTICSYNASLLGYEHPDYRMPCSQVTIFGEPAECVYVQVDGLPGYNSSDPYVCVESSPTASPTGPSLPSESPSPSTPATSSPTSTPTTTPTSTASPEPSASPSPTTTASPSPEPSPSEAPTTTPTPDPVPSSSSTPTSPPAPTSVETPPVTSPESSPTTTPPASSTALTPPSTGSTDRNPFDRTLASTGLGWTPWAILGLASLVAGWVVSSARRKAAR